LLSSSLRTRLAERGYHIERTLGEGTHGQVFRAMSANQGPVAVKVVCEAISHETCTTEIDAMRECAGLGVLPLLDVVEAQDSTALVLQLGEQDLYEFLMQQPSSCLSEDQAKPIFTQLVAAVERCHTLGWVHRDVKLENVIRVGSHIKLADFNLAGPADGPLEACGTPRYVAPEVLYGKSGDPKLADCWSLGIVLFALTAGRFPWELADHRRDSHFRHYLSRMLPWPAHLSTELKDLFSRIFSSANRRPKVSELKNHPWLQGATTSTAAVSAVQLPIKKRKREEDSGCGRAGFDAAHVKCNKALCA